ncbi:MAG TPA: zonular occludens toxin domain-containing protein [Candidatus Saccharimonadales bacterium]|nr:zonular occludens toxin domain-containing protein [Candidatus Saccharimonadales bacterium]
MSKYTNVIQKTYRASMQPIRDDIELRKNKEFFWPTGTQVYIGRQGDGKTISAVKHAMDIKERYPQCIVVSNLSLAWLSPLKLKLSEAELVGVEGLSPRAAERQTATYLAARLAEFMREIDATAQYIQFSSMDELACVLTQVNNGFKGVLYVIDEIHTYLNALDSKNVPMYIFTEISQQRKQRKAIVGTSQLFMRLAKPLREQCDNMIKCKTYFGIFTVQWAYDGETVEQDMNGRLVGDLRRRGWFFHTRKIRNAFDTYQKVVSGVEQYEASVNTTIQITKSNLKALKS